MLLKFGAQVDDEDDDARGLKKQVWSTDVKRNLQRKSPEAWTPLCLAAEERYEEVLFNLITSRFNFHHSHSGWMTALDVCS